MVVAIRLYCMIRSDLPTLEEIRKRRKELGLTQQELAEESGVSQSLIAKIEGSKKYNPRYSTVTKLVHTLDRLSSEGCNVRTAGDIKTSNIKSISKDTTVSKANRIMKKYGFSQLPVTHGTDIIGIITEKTLNNAVALSKQSSQPDFSKYAVNQFVTKDYLLKEESTSLQEIAKSLDVTSAVFTTKNGRVTGIITASNVVDSAFKKQ